MTDHTKALFALIVLLRHTDNPACGTETFEQAVELFEEGDIETALVDQQMSEWPDLDDGDYNDEDDL